MASHVAVDTDAVAAALVRLAEDPDLRHRMGESGRLTVSHRFDGRLWPVCIMSFTLNWLSFA